MRKPRYIAPETRQRIVRAAARKFRDQVIVATALTYLMKAAALTHVVFYKHFDPNDQLVADPPAPAVHARLAGERRRPRGERERGGSGGGDCEASGHPGGEGRACGSQAGRSRRGSDDDRRGAGCARAAGPGGVGGDPAGGREDLDGSAIV